MLRSLISITSGILASVCVSLAKLSDVCAKHVMGGRRSLRIATVVFTSALLLFTTNGIWRMRLLPHRKVWRVLTPGRRYCSHKLHHGIGSVIGNFPRLGDVIDRERISFR
ncbi:hypothetical protein TNCV_737161 [Trichonephila clavipes]|nr:hypothetical protein TNCV_737161 [Trichonephila clavipes]